MILSFLDPDPDPGDGTWCRAGVFFYNKNCGLSSHAIDPLLLKELVLIIFLHVDFVCWQFDGGMESVQDRHVFTVASVFALTSNTTFLLFKDMWWETVVRIRIHRFQIRIQHFKRNNDPDTIRSRVLMTKNRKKIYSLNKNLILFWSKTAIYQSLGLRYGRLSYRRSLQPSNENIQWIRIPDPLTWLNPDPIRIRNRNTGERERETDLCHKLFKS